MYVCTLLHRRNVDHCVCTHFLMLIFCSGLDYVSSILTSGCVCVWFVMLVCTLSLTTSFSYEVTATKFSRNIVKEVLVSLWASVFMGFGMLFLLLWVGIYV